MRSQKLGILKRATGLWLGMLALLLLVGGRAEALTIPLNVEFDDGTVGSYGSVEITEDGNGALIFKVSVLGNVGQDLDLGPNADLHELYFNLQGSVGPVAIMTLDAVGTPYVLTSSPSVKGGAGSSFEYGVNFGNGAGASGNGVLKMAMFKISAEDCDLVTAPEECLSLDQVIGEKSSTSGSGVSVNVAVHVQGTNLVQDADSETVGGMVPEPSMAWLLGVAVLAGIRRRRRAL
jgi:hypothetical protein